MKLSEIVEEYEGMGGGSSPRDKLKGTWHGKAHAHRNVGLPFRVRQEDLGEVWQSEKEYIERWKHEGVVTVYLVRRVWQDLHRTCGRKEMLSSQVVAVLECSSVEEAMALREDWKVN